MFSTKLRFTKTKIIYSSEPFGYRILKYIVRGAVNKFPNIFVQAFKIVVDFWTFSMLLPYILWDDWPILLISASNEQLQQQLEYTLLKPDCHCWWISKMQSDTLEEQYAIKFCFKLGKNATETYGMLQTAIYLMRWLTNFYDFRLKSTATAGIGIHPTKAWLSQLVNFMNAIWDLRRTICNKILF